MTSQPLHPDRQVSIVPPTTHLPRSPKREAGRQLLQEVARRANVSPATVSRALSGATRGIYGKIAERNKLIRKIADELNYRPSFGARAFQSGKTFTVALLYPGGALQIGAQYGIMIGSAVDTLLERDYHLTLWGLSPEKAADSDIFLNRRFDGFLIHDALAVQVHPALERSGAPAVLLNSTSLPGVPTVVPADRQAAAQLTQQLLAIGHRRIEMISSPAAHWSAQEREAGYRDAMSEAGLNAVVQHATLEPFDPAELDWSRKPTAFVAWSSRQALVLHAWCRERGISIPEDLSLVTFGPNDALGLVRPGITAAEVPWRTIGHRSANLLLEMIDHEQESAAIESIVLSESIAERASTAPPRTTP